MLIYIDFDNTITMKDLYYYLNLKDMKNCINEKNLINELETIDIFRIMGSNNRIKILDKFFLDLKKKKHRLVILTRNYEKIIECFLRKISLLEYFSAIIGLETLQKYHNKASIKADYLLNNHHILDPFDILILDDSAKQIEHINEKCDWIKTYKIRSFTGLSYFDIINIGYLIN